MQRIDPQFLAPGSHILSCQHSGIRRGLVTIGLDFHATGDTGDGFAATGITQISLCLCRRRQEHGQPAEDHVRIYLRSVTWTNVSLKDANMRATPKTSSPVRLIARLVSHL